MKLTAFAAHFTSVLGCIYKWESIYCIRMKPILNVIFDCEGLLFWNTFFKEAFFSRDVEAKGLIDLWSTYIRISQWKHFFIRSIIIWFYCYNSIALILSSIIVKINFFVCLLLVKKMFQRWCKLLHFHGSFKKKFLFYFE